MYTEEQKRAHITSLQTYLRRIQQHQGYPTPVAPDGIYGPDTAAAVLDFQRAHGLRPSGVADYPTWQAIYALYQRLTAMMAAPASVSFAPLAPDAVLREGDRGNAVLAVQMVLNGIAPRYLNIPFTVLTGEYDAQTAQAVRAAQRAFGLPVTGITDRATWDRLAALHGVIRQTLPPGW